MNCPKCGAKEMSRDKPVYYNSDNHEGDYLFHEEIYQCHICGKVIFIHQDYKIEKKTFIKGQVITSGIEEHRFSQVAACDDVIQ